MASPNGKQARSPKDKPSTRVFGIRSPANRALRGERHTLAGGASVGSQASSGRSPRSTSLPCTSARFTVPAAAALRSSGVSVSAPGSRLKTVSSAKRPARPYSLRADPRRSAINSSTRDPQPLAKGGGDDDAAVLVDPRTGFECHVSPVPS